MLAVLFSAMAGYYIAFHATGGPIAKIGFAGMSTAWIVTTMMAYVAVRNGHIKKHQQWMIRSYAVTFTGVTFRLWLPFLIFICDMKFLEAYPIDAWVSWITNLVIAEFIIRKSFQKERTVPAHI